MKLKKFLRQVEFYQKIIIYYEDDDEPVWEGYWKDVPYDLARRELIDLNEKEDLYPISYRDDLGEEYDHKSGFVVCLKAYW